MSSSTFSFKSKVMPRAYFGEAVALLVSLGVFLLLTVGWLTIARVTGERFRPLSARAIVPRSKDLYLAYFNGDLEHYVIYDDLDGAADALKRADVLFLGNSRVEYAFRDRAVLRDFFLSRSMNYFVMAFGFGEGSDFPEAVIRKFNLHPKWVIVNADPFFGMATSAAASQTITYSYFQAWKNRFETDTSLTVERHLYKIFPYLGLSQFDDHPQWLEYRAKSDGILQPAAWRGTPQPVLPNHGDYLGQHTSPDQLKEARDFKREMDARGARLILTWIPPSSGNAARYVADSIHVPLIVPEQTRLMTIDGSHLDYPSSERFSKSFLVALSQLIVRPDAMAAGDGKVLNASRRSP